MDISVGGAIFAVGALVFGGLFVVLLFDGIVFAFNPDRGRELMALQAALIHSIFKSKRGDKTPREHRRLGDAQPREHRRQTPTSPPTIRMFAQQPPKRRSGDSEPEN